MALQLNVSQQNEVTRAQMRRVARLFASGDVSLAWLRNVLSEQGLSAASGLLVQLVGTPEQEGEHYAGLWLTHARQFWAFTVVVPRQEHGAIEVERFENVTEETVVSEHVPGTGKSLGFMALEELHAQNEG